MDVVLFEDVVVSLELVIAVIELLVLVGILIHMKRMREHAVVEKEELKEIRKLHVELGEAVRLLKEDIRDLTENQREMQDIMKALAKR
jgi:hypothetical protein